MNCKLITVASHLEVEGLHKLIQSCQKFVWPLQILQAEWRGFSTKLLTVKDYLISNTEITHFFFCDAYDCVVLGTMEEALSKLDKDKITVSSERGCWPQPDLEKYYQERFDHRYNYLNSGLYFAPRDKFLKLFEVDPPEYASDDQLFLTNKFLFEDHDIVLDNNCEVFQSYSFVEDGDFTYDYNAFYNVKTGTFPILIHGNGRSDLTKIYELI